MSGPGAQLIARNSVLNLIGQIAPLAVGVFAIPPLISGLGDDRFGILAIAWMFLGYFGLFDLGLSRALTHMIAEREGAGSRGEIRALIWTTLTATFAVSALVGAAAWLLSPWVVRSVLNMPTALEAETIQAFHVIAASVPVIVSSANLRGILEARQRFDVITAVRIPLGILTFGAPLVVLAFTTSLFWIAISLVAARALAWLAFLVACVRLTEMSDGVAFDRAILQPLFGFGGWMTVSNVISPIMVYIDRFLIGAILTVAAVTYYATPWEVVTKLALIPAGISAVLFPAFSYWFRADATKAGDYFRTGLKTVLLVLFPAVLLVVVLADWGLTLWLGDAFASRSFRPMQILAIGVLFNGLAAIPFAFLQGLGRPDITAKLHAAELPFYLALLWWMVSSFGIVGAAVAWMIRVAVDYYVLYAVSARLTGLSWLDQTTAAVTVSAAACGGLMLLTDPAAGLLAGIVVLAGFILVSWQRLVDRREKDFIQQKFGKVLRWV